MGREMDFLLLEIQCLIEVIRHFGLLIMGFALFITTFQAESLPFGSFVLLISEHVFRRIDHAIPWSYCPSDGISASA